MSRPRGGSGRYSVDKHRQQRRDRQQVRSRGRGVGTSAQGRSSSPARLGPAPRRVMSTGTRRIRRQLGGRRTAAWGALSLILMTVALLTWTLGWTIATLTSLAVTGVVNRVEARRAGDTAPPPPRKVAKDRQNAPGARAGGATAQTRSKPKAKPAGGGRRAICNHACRTSTKPKSTCRCKAEDCRHGSEAPTLKV